MISLRHSAVRNVWDIIGEQFIVFKSGDTPSYAIKITRQIGLLGNYGVGYV